MKMRAACTALALLCTLFIFPAEGTEDLWSKPPLFEGMGNHTMPIESDNNLAQKYFDQGLILYYGFNYPEAARSFREAFRLAPGRGICCWGEALALGECIDDAGDHWCVSTCRALDRAQAHLPESDQKFTDLILALSERYKKGPEGYRIDHAPYIEKMKELCKKYPDDTDIIAIYVKGHMDNVDMMEGMQGRKPVGATKEILDAIDRGLALNPLHPGLLHFKIHALENCGLSDEGVKTADTLKDLVPGSGHLQHMPAHIYFYVGRYHDATNANYSGIQADEKLFKEGGIKVPEFAGFYLHNHYFLFNSLMMEGRSQETLEQASKLVGQLKSGEYPSNTRLRDIFFSIPYLSMARFGKWEAISNQPPPPRELLYATGAWQYANGLAAVRNGDSNAALRRQVELDKLQQEYEKNAPKDPLGKLLMLSKFDLSSQIARAAGDTDRQIRDLSDAIILEDTLNLEMLPWYFPLRQAIGAALLQNAVAANAEQAYRDDLKRHPHNGWSLYGLAKALEAQGKIKESREVQNQFSIAWQYADLQLAGSRF